jgi:hypothetical protein
LYRRHREKERVMTLGDDEDASIGAGALVVFISLMIAAAILSSILIRLTEVITAESSSDADRGTTNVGAFVHIIRLEIIGYDSTNVVADSLMLIFEFPYAQRSIGDTEVVWVIGCPATGGAASDQGYLFDRGTFSLATNLNGDGQTAGDLTEFESVGVYFLRVKLKNCDIEPSEAHVLIISVVGGNLVSKNIKYDSAPYSNQDLM